MDVKGDTLAARIRAARIGIGLSQTELAKALHVNRSTVGHWEREEGFSPSMDHLRAMSRIMGVSLNWLVQGIDPIVEPCAGTVRASLESRLVSLSRHLPTSFLASLVALMENAERYL